MAFTPIQNLIPRAARKHGIYGAMQAIQVCKEAERAIDEIFKKRKHQGVKPKSITKGVLKITVPNSTWAQEVTLHRQKIIDRVNGKMGKKAVKSVKVRSR